MPRVKVKDPQKDVYHAMLSPVVLADFSEDDLKMGQISGFPFEKPDALTQAFRCIW